MRILGIEDAARRAYAAGIIDGEAYIGANRIMPTAANRKTTPKYRIRVCIAMADREPIAAVAALVGVEDRIFVRDRKVKPHHSPMFVLDLESHKAIALLRLVLPYLTAKKGQALLLCEFYDFKATARQYRTDPGLKIHFFKSGPQVGKQYTTRQQSREYVARCDAFYLALRRRPVTNSGHVARPL